MPPADTLPPHIWKDVAPVEGEFVGKFQAWKALTETKAEATFSTYTPVKWSYKQKEEGMFYEV